MENEISVHDAFKRQIETAVPVTGKHIRKLHQKVDRAYGTSIVEGDIILAFKIDNQRKDGELPSLGMDTVLMRNLGKFEEDYELVEGGPDVNVPKFCRIRQATS